MKKWLSFVICIVWAFALIFGGGKVVYAQEQGAQSLYNFNTESIVVLEGQNANKAFEDIQTEFEKIDQTFSLNHESEIKKLVTSGVKAHDSHSQIVQAKIWVNCFYNTVTNSL